MERAGLASASPRRVWVVEDDEPFRELLARRLRALGHEVADVAGWESSQPPPPCDVAFLDHYFLSRSLNGTLLTRILKGLPEPPYVVGMSSVMGANERMRAQGADDVILKAEFRRLLALS